MPIKTRIAISGIFYNLDLSKNIRKIQAAVNPNVSMLKVEKVRLIIYNGFVRGV